MLLVSSRVGDLYVRVRVRIRVRVRPARNEVLSKHVDLLTEDLGRTRVEVLRLEGEKRFVLFSYQLSLRRLRSFQLGWEGAHASPHTWLHMFNG